MTDSGPGPAPGEERPPPGNTPAGTPPPPPTPEPPAAGQSGDGGWVPPRGQAGWPPPPGPPTYGSQQGYQQPPYPYAPAYPAPQTEGGAIGALVCAIGSFFVCPVILAVIALVLASSSDKKIAQSRGALTGESLNRAARIIAWIHLALAAAALGFVILFFIAAAASRTDNFNFGLLLARTVAA